MACECDTHCDLVVGHPVRGCDLVSDPVADRCGRLGTHAGDVVGHVLDAVQETAGRVVSALEGRVHLAQSKTVRVRMVAKVRVKTGNFLYSAVSSPQDC